MLTLLKFVDCVWQLLDQFPRSFEFTGTYLIALMEHVYSGLYGSFLFNNDAERAAAVKGTFHASPLCLSTRFSIHLVIGTPPLSSVWPALAAADGHVVEIRFFALQMRSQSRNTDLFCVVESAVRSNLHAADSAELEYQALAPMERCKARSFHRSPGAL